MPTFTFGNIQTFKIDATDGGALSDISAAVTKTSYSAKRDTTDFKGSGNAAVIKLVGPVAATFTLEMGYDPTIAAIFQTAMGSTTPVTRSVEHGPAGNATGQPKETAEVYVASFEHEADSENPTTMTAELVVSGAVTYATF